MNGIRPVSRVLVVVLCVGLVPWAIAVFGSAPQRSGSIAAAEPSRAPASIPVLGPGEVDEDGDGDEDEDEDADEQPDGPGMATACCTKTGCLDLVEPADCVQLGGAPFGLCATCAGITCPDPGCIGATGNCGERQTTPGCDLLYCCDQICDSDPFCCEVQWDERCAGAPCAASGDETPCCGPNGACGVGSSSVCTGSGGETVAQCLGDGDGDGIDDACACQPAGGGTY